MTRFNKSTVILFVTLLLAACTTATKVSEKTALAKTDLPLATETAATKIPEEAAQVQSNQPRDLSPQATDADLAKLVGGNNDFAFALYHQIAAGDGNLLYSPYSISIALAMTYAGARGGTATQMAQALHFALPSESLHPSFNKLALELQSRSEAKGITPDKAFHLSVANSLWGQSGSPFEPDFLYLLARNYGAGMRSADFAADSEAARQAINDWVSQSTEDRIKDIIPPGALDAFTRMVLANAVYFKAAWEHPFAQQFTSAQPFQLLDGSSISVPTMVEAEDMGYLQGDGYRAVDLPYAGGQLSMLILLPDEGRFGDMEGKLNPALINDTVSKLTTGEVILSMPKFKFEWSTGLSDGLAALGMVDAFDPRRADFSGIDGKHDLSISAALHKAFIAVDESGTEAAAATVILAVGSDMTNVPKVQLDRPFFFLIRDNPTGTILFVGRVVNPSVS